MHIHFFCRQFSAGNTCCFQNRSTWHDSAHGMMNKSLVKQKQSSTHLGGATNENNSV